MDFSNLSEFEKMEIKNYNEIYFISKLKNDSLHKLDKDKDIHNELIFSDEDSRFRYKIGDSIIYRYEILNKLGKGSYSNVVLCKDHKTEDMVSIKMFKNFSKNRDNSFKKEIKILKYLSSKMDEKKCHFVTQILNNFVFHRHDFIVSKVYDKNLYDDRIKIYNSNINNKLTIIKDIFYGLNFLRSGRPKIVHGDLKPENILFKSRQSFNIVICDFGLSEILHGDKVNFKTTIQSGYYRSPDIIYKIPFNEKIDIWSAGCIMYEILENKPLFKANTDNNIMVSIHEVLGQPDENYKNSDINIIMFYQFFVNKDRYKRIIIPKNLAIKLDKYINIDILKANQEDLILKELFKLIYKCLEYDPFKRIHSFDALKYIDENIFK